MFWLFWSPLLFFTAVSVAAAVLGVAAVKDRRTAAATFLEALGRTTWSIAAMVWLAWTAPGLATHYESAMNKRLLPYGIWDPIELLLQFSQMPRGAAASFDRWLLCIVALIVATLIEVVVFHVLHRRDLTRNVARAVSAGITALIALPLWALLVIIAVQTIDLWRRLQ